MWIISEIGGKNMTGILQNTIAERFFLTRYRLEF
jgi:hypothetical protein